MKRLSFAAFFLIVVLSACSKYSYYSVGSNNANYSKYSTFAWLPPAVPNSGNNTNATTGGTGVTTGANNDIVDERIKEAATTELENRGLTLKARNPDLLVRYSIMLSDKVRTYDEPVYTYYGGGFYPRVGYYRGRRLCITLTGHHFRYM